MFQIVSALLKCLYSRPETMSLMTLMTKVEALK